MMTGKKIAATLAALTGAAATMASVTFAGFIKSRNSE